MSKVGEIVIPGLSSKVVFSSAIPDSVTYDGGDEWHGGPYIRY